MKNMGTAQHALSPFIRSRVRAASLHQRCSGLLKTFLASSKYTLHCGGESAFGKTLKSIAWLRIHKSRGNSPVVDTRLQVRNLTRQTMLASSLQVADDGARRRTGLLGRKQLPPGEGLWIVPCEAVHTIGMQFPIDLVYLDRKHRIKKVRRNVSPWRLSACLSAHSVLELAAGTIHSTQSRPGDRVEFSAAL